MNLNSSSSFLSSSHLRVCQPTHQLSPALATLAEKLASVEERHPFVAIMIRNTGIAPVLAGNRALFDDLLNAEPYVGRFQPTQRGIIVMNEKRVRLSWIRCPHGVVIFGLTRTRGEAIRTFEKSIARNLDIFARLSRPV